MNDDLIMISDIDEIPDPNKINEFQIKNKYGCFILKNFQSKFNQINVTQKIIGVVLKYAKRNI